LGGMDIAQPIPEPRKPFKELEREAVREGVQQSLSPTQKPTGKLRPHPRLNGPKAQTSGELSRTLLATYGNHHEKQIAVAESGQERWKSNEPHRGYFKAAVIGVAKKSNLSENVSLNPLLPDITPPRYESDERFRQDQSKIIYSNFIKPPEQENMLTQSNTSKLDSKSNITLDDQALRARNDSPGKKVLQGSARWVEESSGDVASSLEKLVPSTPLTHTAHASATTEFRNNPLTQRRPSVESASKLEELPAAVPVVGITCLVSLQVARIAIGACTDSLFRFWDLSSGKVVCSCSVSLELRAVISEQKTNNNMLLSCLTLTPDESLLIGGYDSGEIRVWLISVSSINGIRSSQKEFISGISVPPIQLLSEWNGHESSVRSLEVVILDESNWGSHEHYLVSSGQDQAVHLWTVSGEKVGSFGTSSGWDLDDRDSWVVNKSKFDLSFYLSTTPQLGPAPPTKSKPSFWRGNQTKKYRIDPNDTSTNYFRMATLHRHMEKIKIKNHNKLIEPSTTEVHCNMVTDAQMRYPIVVVDDSTKKLKPASPRKRAKSAGVSRTHKVLLS